MGLIKYGPLAQEVSGSVGGVTFARVHDGKAVRGWRAPVNKHRPLQRTYRNILARASTEWFSTLTPTQRSDWDTYSPTCVFTNALGEPYTISGFNMFTRNRMTQLLYALPADYEAPLIGGFPNTHTPAVVFTHATGVLQVTSITPDIDNDDYIIFRVYNYTKSSRSYPVFRTMGAIKFLGIDAFPYIVWTFYLPLPYSSGYVQSVAHVYIYDSFRRLSIPTLNMTLST